MSPQLRFGDQCRIWQSPYLLLTSRDLAAVGVQAAAAQLGHRWAQGLDHGHGEGRRRGWDGRVKGPALHERLYRRVRLFASPAKAAARGAPPQYCVVLVGRAAVSCSMPSSSNLLRTLLMYVQPINYQNSRHRIALHDRGLDVCGSFAIGVVTLIAGRCAALLCWRRRPVQSAADNLTPGSRGLLVILKQRSYL